MLGELFVVGAFDFGEHKSILGELDNSRTVVMPVFGDYFFKDSAFHVQIQPQRLQIDFRNDQILPTSLCEIAVAAADALTGGSPAGSVKAIGVNLDAIVNQDELGETGVEFCARHFISSSDEWKEMLSPDGNLSNAGRLVYNKGGIKYTIRFEPHFKSDMNNLYIDFNAHQEIEPSVTHSDALGKYNVIRSYISNVIQSALV